MTQQRRFSWASRNRHFCILQEFFWVELLVLTKLRTLTNDLYRTSSPTTKMNNFELCGNETSVKLHKVVCIPGAESCKVLDWLQSCREKNTKFWKNWLMLLVVFAVFRRTIFPESKKNNLVVGVIFFVFLKLPMTRRCQDRRVVGVLYFKCIGCYRGSKVGDGGFQSRCRP